MRAYLDAFFGNRKLRVRLSGWVSSARPVTTGVPQDSVLSPFLFSPALASLPTNLPNIATSPVHVSLYANDVAIWCTDATKHHRNARAAAQLTLNTVVSRLARLGLEVSCEKTAALVYRSKAQTARRTPPLLIGDTPLPWQKQARYLGITLHHRLTRVPLVPKLRAQPTDTQRIICSLVARGSGCTQEWALRIYNAAAVSNLAY
ncbi:hypothetical protein HPB48_021957 [Haemaphysalis longicornis]|uniref:Reverse transcriptase domain-containing protein n=1 Tax=Haemaphysalis longicornis TaxID=44386 RepID=A0A9J6FWJ4_HAELO|nr:hypothetical protein HPB48_021957 [Haemaphysalis longicornis]